MYKKRFLRLVSAVLALCMMAALLPTAAFADAATSNEFSYEYQGKTLKYTVNEDGKTVSVAEQGWNVVSGDVGIPEMVSYDSKDYAVTDIGESAFEWCRALTKITIPDSVINIKNKAFYDCNKLESVAVSQNSKLTNIGIEAFRGCSSLKTVDLPKSVTAIGDRAFYNCKELASVVIPAGVSNIKIATFLGCTALESITFKEGSILTSIEQNAFYECEKLKSITLPKGLTSIAQSAFYKTALTSIEIPDSVVSIGGDAFCACTNLQRIKIPASTCNVAGNIFTACYKPIAVTYGGAQEQWDNFGVELPEGSTVICTGHTVKFDPNGHGTTPKNVYVENGKTIEKPADPTETGYTFKGWYYTENGVEKEFAFGENGTPVTSSMTLKAKWEINRYTVKFMNGEDEVKSIPADYNSTIAINDAPVAPVKEGYVFGGWYSGSEKFVFDETKVTSDLTLTAKWTKGSYTLTVDGNAENHVYDEEVTVDEPTKEGYTFAGWTVETKNVTPTKGDDCKWRFKMPAGNVTLTAKWEINRYTVKFMNGEDEVKSIPADYNSTIAVNDAPAAPVKEGFVFGGWYNGTEKFVFGETKVTSDLTLTAKWTKGSYTLTVDGSAEGHDYDEEVTVDEPTKEGYTFAGWTVEPENVTPTKGDDCKWRFKMPAGNVTLTAEWKINEYTVIFVTAHDNTPNSLTVKHGETISGDRVLKADGYEFGGWYNGTEKFVFGENGTKVTGNLTLTARWTEVKKPEPKPEPVVYEIVVDNGTAYLDDGATAIHTAEEGQTVILKVNPEALTEGVAFDKWEIVSGDVKLADETASETTFEMPASDVELKATVKSIEPAAEPLTGLEQAALLTTGTVVAGAGVAAVGFAAYGIGVELYAQALLPAGAALPTNCGELAVLVWNMAGKPQPALPAEGLTDAQTALLWAAESGLLPAQAGATPEDPEHPVSARDVARALRKARSFAPKG